MAVIKRGVPRVKISAPSQRENRPNPPELGGYLGKMARATINARLLPDLLGRAADVPLRRLVQDRAAPRVEGLRRP